MARKIGTLITTILMILATALQVIVVSTIMNGNLGFNEYNTEPMPIIAYVAIGFTQILFLITLIPTKKKGLVFGSILLIIGILLQIIAIVTTMWVTNALFLFAGIIIFLGAIFHFIGCIQYKENNLAGIITGFLFFLIVIGQNFVVGALLPWIVRISPDVNMIMRMFIIGSAANSLFYILHGLVLSFSKKQLYADDGAEDLLSVESGDAFASYVPSSKKKTRPEKPKKKSKKAEEEDFTFDF